jgi:hypothetical protein
MVDSGTITRLGAPVGGVDPVTWEQAVGESQTVYSGPCAITELRVQNPKPSGVGGDYPVAMVATLRLPAQGAHIQVQDVFVLDSAPDHPQEVGMRFRITSFNPKTQAKARLFQMESVIA